MTTEIILGILIYLSGCLISYVLIKKLRPYSWFGLDRNKWTKTDRAYAVGNSLLSWVEVIICLISFLMNIEYWLGGDEDAKW